MAKDIEEEMRRYVTSLSQRESGSEMEPGEAYSAELVRDHCCSGLIFFRTPLHNAFSLALLLITTYQRPFP